MIFIRKHLGTAARSAALLARKLRTFDYSDLSFLYVACLFTIALVYSIFRVSQYYLAQQEIRAMDAIQQVGHQREVVSELERLIAFAQNRTAPQYPVTARLLADTYVELVQQHVKILPKIAYLKSQCANHPCADAFNPKFFAIPTEQIQIAIGQNRLTLRAHNELLQQLFDYAVRYHMALKDALATSFALIQSKNKTNVTFDFVAYLSLLALLLVQAVYVFRPAIRRLNASLATRSEFMSRISHEIRNPMNSIIGMADILKGTKLNSEQAHYVDNLIRSGHALLDMLNNLIDSSALERGKLQLKTGTFDLYKSVDRALNLIALPAHHKNINIYLHMNPAVPAHLIGDSVRLEQVLINLLSNAVKFTEQGHVLLDIDARNRVNNRLEIEIAVSDTGIGIQPGLMAHIFDSFVQADSSIQRKYGGSGLGLAIASELIRMMGGELKVTSEYGQGSRFYFTISLEAQNTGEKTEATPLIPLSDRRFIYLVSYAESHAYRRFFEQLNSQVVLLHSSQDLRGFLSGGPAPNIDEVLIDDSIGIISMITCRNLVEQSGLSDKSVAVIRSAFTKENMDLLTKNGFTRFIVKPLKPWDILELPHPTREDNQQPAQINSLTMVKKLKEKNLRILLVDDSNDNLFLLKEVVNPLASTVHFAENGLEAIEKFTRNNYDVVFMDIQMPVMDGYTAIRKMRDTEDQTKRGIPIYAVTAHAGLADAQKCREAGFTDRIVKPVVRSDIYSSLSKVFKLTTGGLEFEKDQAIPEKYLEKLMPTFIKTRKDDMEKLGLALVQQDFEAIAKLGHKMKGSTASYGFQDAFKLSEELERAAKAKNFAACEQLTRELHGIFNALS